MESLRRLHRRSLAAHGARAMTRSNKAWMAHPRQSYELAIVRDAVLLFIAIVVLVAAASTGYA